MIENESYELKRGARGVQKLISAKNFMHAGFFSCKLVQIDNDFDCDFNLQK